MISEVSSLAQRAPTATRALIRLAQAHIHAAQSPHYWPMPPDETRCLTLECRQVSDADLDLVCLHAPEPGVRVVFQAERELRKGNALSWLFRGVFPDHSADLVTMVAVAPRGP